MIIHKYTRFENINDKFVEINSKFFKDYNNAKQCAKEFIEDLKDESNLQFEEQSPVNSDEEYHCAISYDGYYNNKTNILITIIKIYVYE